MKANELYNQFKNNEYKDLLRKIYVDESVLEAQKTRYMKAIETFVNIYGNKEVEIYSAPGRSEVGGNHTDHQHGEVLAAAINLDIIGVVSKEDQLIKIQSDQYDIKKIDINKVESLFDEQGTSEALVKGVVSRFKELGYHVGGFNGYFTSDVLVGSGMSSSAAFEVLIGTILSGLYNKMTIDPVTIAQIGQYAENVYFGKPCGLMDQCASSVGCLIHIDFKDPKQPVVNKIDVDFSSFNHSLCIVDTLGDHADLTPDYAAVPTEMKSVAKIFGCEVLREVSETDFYERFSEVRKQCGDRAALRAMHLFEENKRVEKEVKALKENNFDLFKETVVLSGDSSYKYLQNVYSPRDPQNQSVSIALALSEKLLGDKGVCRVHGGGFAGTIQAFVEDDYVLTYKQKIEKFFGEGTCHVLKIRMLGGTKVI